MIFGCVCIVLLSSSLCPPARAAQDTGAAGASSSGAAPVTRISPVPPGAPEWPLWTRPAAVSRSDELEERELVLVSDGGSWTPSGARWAKSSAPEARRFRDGPRDNPRDNPRDGPRDGPRHRHAPHDREGATVVGAAFTGPGPDAVYGSGYARPAPTGFSHRDDEPPTAYMWEEDDSGSHAAPPSGDIVLDVALPHKEDDDHGKTARGPVVVRGPPFNSVAIGFLVYLILLTVLQTSILNVTTKPQGLTQGLAQGLLGLLRPPPATLAPPARSMAERRAADPLLETLDPVLVAAVLDSDEQTLGGPRRARGRSGRGRSRGAVPSKFAKTFKE